MNPWKVISQKEVYDNNWIRVTEFNVINPSGGKGIYGKVHFKNVAIGVIALDDDLNTYLVGQYRFPLEQYSWEIPEGGGAHEVEDIESAKRELLEETGLEAAEWTKLFNFHLSNSVSDERGAIFLARKLSQREPEPEETEELIIKTVPFDEAYQMVLNGKITDIMSVSAILRVKIMLLEGTIK
ncbi:MAG TPA: NUDIX hydrolase [Chitinophagaceae bacterium]